MCYFHTHIPIHMYVYVCVYVCVYVRWFMYTRSNRSITNSGGNGPIRKVRIVGGVG